MIDHSPDYVFTSTHVFEEALIRFQRTDADMVLWEKAIAEDYVKMTKCGWEYREESDLDT